MCCASQGPERGGPRGRFLGRLLGLAASASRQHCVLRSRSGSASMTTCLQATEVTQTAPVGAGGRQPHPPAHLHRGRHSGGGLWQRPLQQQSSAENLCWTTAHGLQPSRDDGGRDTSGKLPGSGPGVPGSTSVQEPSSATQGRPSPVPCSRLSLSSSMPHGCQKTPPALAGTLVKTRAVGAQGGANTLSPSHLPTCQISTSLNYKEKTYYIS